MAKYRGTLRRSDLEGGFWQLITDDGDSYVLDRASLGAEGDVTHFVTLTHWESLQAIEAFAGHEVERAKYYPEDADFLLEFEPEVQHSELYS